MSVAASPALSNGLLATTAGATISGGASTAATNSQQITTGWSEVEMKKSDMDASLANHMTPPPISHP